VLQPETTGCNRPGDISPRRCQDLTSNNRLEIADNEKYRDRFSHHHLSESTQLRSTCSTPTCKRRTSVRNRKRKRRRQRTYRRSSRFRRIIRCRTCLFHHPDNRCSLSLDNTMGPSSSAEPRLTVSISVTSHSALLRRMSRMRNSIRSL